MNRTLLQAMLLVVGATLAQAADVAPAPSDGGGAAKATEPQDFEAMIDDIKARFKGADLGVDLDQLKQGAAPSDLAAARMQLDAVEQALVESLSRQAELQAQLEAANQSHADSLRAANQEIAKLQARDKDAGQVAAAGATAAAAPAVDPTMGVYPFKMGPGIRLTQVHFNSGTATLSPGGLRKTKETAAWLKANQDGRRVKIMAFSDTTGAPTPNKTLAMARAQSVAALLTEAGISSSAIDLMPYGEEMLPEATGDQIAEPLNRCVGIFLADQG